MFSPTNIRDVLLTAEWASMSSTSTNNEDGDDDIAEDTFAASVTDGNNARTNVRSPGARPIHTEDTPDSVAPISCLTQSQIASQEECHRLLQDILTEAEDVQLNRAGPSSSNVKCAEFGMRGSDVLFSHTNMGPPFGLDGASGFASSAHSFGGLLGCGSPTCGTFGHKSRGLDNIDLMGLAGAGAATATLTSHTRPDFSDASHGSNISRDCPSRDQTRPHTRHRRPAPPRSGRQTNNTCTVPRNRSGFGSDISIATAMLAAPFYEPSKLSVLAELADVLRSEEYGYPTAI